MATKDDKAAEVEPVDPNVEVMKKHIQHAQEHGMHPGHRYALHMHNESRPADGVLVGTNELGLLFHTEGSARHSFHPWSGVRGLYYAGE